MNWKNIEISDKDIIDQYTKEKFEICDYNFNNLFLWSLGDNIQFKIEDEVLFIKGNYLNEESYFMPISLLEDVEKVRDGIGKILSTGKKVYLIPEEWKIKLEPYYSFTERRDNFDYIYLKEDLKDLKGRRYTKKRNKVNQFMKLYNYKYNDINSENLDKVVEFQKKWLESKNREENKDLFKEGLGLDVFFKNFNKLGFLGGYIEVEEKVIGYTIAEKLREDILIIHIEKADEKYNGSYQAINQIFLQNQKLEYKYINREDDSGIAGIRQAKESYFPEKMLKKYTVSN